MKLVFANSVKKDLRRISRDDSKSILKKLEFYSDQPDPLDFAEHLTDHMFGDYRFRIGNYRALCDINNDTIFVLKIGHRKDIYR